MVWAILISCPLAASSRPSSPLNCLGAARLPTSISMGNIRPSYNERLPDWSNRPPPGVDSSTLPRRPTSLGSNFRPNHRQYLSPFDTPPQYNSMNVDSWQNTLYPHTPSGNIGGIVTPTFVVTPPEAETASNHSYLEVPVSQNKCYNNPAPDEICDCEKEAMRSKQEATGMLKRNGSNVEKSSPNSVNWKAEVIRRYRERLEQKQNVDPEEIKCHLTNGVHNDMQEGRINVDTCESENGADSHSTCSTLEADWDSLSSSSHRINETHNPVSKDSERAESKRCSKDGGGSKFATCGNKHGKLTEEEMDKKIREVQEIVTSLESIPSTLDNGQIDRSSKYRVPFSSIDKVRESPLLKSFPSGARWKEDFFSSMLNLDLAMLDENSCSSSCHSSLSLTQDVSPRDLIFGCGRVAELARHFTQLGESERCNVRRTKSEPDISPRTDKRRQDSDYTVVYSVGLKSVGFSVDQNSGGALEVHDVDCSGDKVSVKSPSFDLEKVCLPEEIAEVDSRCISPPSDHNSSGSEDSNSPWVQLRRLLQAESKRSEGNESNREDDLEELSVLKEEPVTNMWARMKKLVKGGSASGDDDCTSGQVSTSWMYKTDVKAKPEKTKSERKTKKKSTVSLDSSYLSFDVTANEPVMKNSISENCLISSVSRDSQLTVFSRGERSRSEEALLQKKKPKRRVVFSCVQENSDGEKSPSIQRYSVTKPNLPGNDSPSVQRYSVTKPVETRPKFPDAYIRKRTCQSVEDLPNRTREVPVQRNLARQFVSMPHIMHPLYIGGHTHLIPIRANSDETICRHLHCAHLNNYNHPCE